MQTNNIHGPDPKNTFAPYFSPELKKACKRDMELVLAHFPNQTISELIVAIRRRACDGAFAESDLLGTIVKINGSTGKDNILRKRTELYQLVGRTPGNHNHFQYWFFQVSGRPSLGTRTAVANASLERLPFPGAMNFLRNESIKNLYGFRKYENTTHFFWYSGRSVFRWALFICTYNKKPVPNLVPIRVSRQLPSRRLGDKSYGLSVTITFLIIIFSVGLSPGPTREVAIASTVSIPFTTFPNIV